MSGCPYVAEELKTKALSRVITQYRETPLFRSYIELFLDQLEELNEVFCDLRGAFDVDDAEGDQLDKLGISVGWPRCHCAGKKKVYFGFICGTCGFDPGTVDGFCDGSFPCPEIGEAATDYEDFCFTDDEQYRTFIKAKIIRNRSKGTAQDWLDALEILFGVDAKIMFERGAVLTIATGRVLTAEEKQIIHLFERVLPVPRGVRLEIIEVEKPFGFGTGWDGFCDGAFGHILN